MAGSSGILFLNPRAGSFSEADEAVLRGRAGELGLRIVELTPAADVRSVLRTALDAGLRNFVVAGGDGTIHNLAQTLVGTDGILGIVPIGTVNHMARDLQIPADWHTALEIAVHGEIRQIDTGRVNEIHFLNSVIVGIYPTIAEYRERFRSTHSKWRAYLRALRPAVRQFRHISLVIEMRDRVETIRTQLFVVAVNSYNLTQAGLVALKNSLDDGRLTIYTFGFMSRWQFVRAAAKFFRGKVEQVDGFRRVRTEVLRIDAASPVIRVAVDGEVRSLAPPLQISAVPASLLVRVPRS
ncbi:MAG TPA: diacylglycerol kinase family protein [Thermoanaerobaculia bacterium]|nr:diacylglycerol kinase family protein [Thermoanaerobaculia bacterium]